MFRLILLLISLISFILFGNQRKKIFFNTGYYKGSNRTGLSDFVRLTLRRRNSIKQCRRYFSKEKEFYKLKNNYVTLIYNSSKKVIKCIDKTIKKRTMTVDWYEQTSNELDYIDNVFEEMFDNICALFNERSNYDGISAIFLSQFIIHEMDENGIIDRAIKRYRKLVNINSATEEEITAVPGLSIVHAKNIVKIRTRINGFKSYEQFCRKIKINSHYQEQLRYYIFAGNYTPPDPNSTEKTLREHNNLLILKDSDYKNNERIIDL